VTFADYATVPVMDAGVGRLVVAPSNCVTVVTTVMDAPDDVKLDPLVTITTLAVDAAMTTPHVKVLSVVGCCTSLGRARPVGQQCLGAVAVDVQVRRRRNASLDLNRHVEGVALRRRVGHGEGEKHREPFANCVNCSPTVMGEPAWRVVEVEVLVVEVDVDVEVVVEPVVDVGPLAADGSAILDVVPARSSSLSLSLLLSPPF